MGFRDSSNHWKYSLPLFAGIQLVRQYDDGTSGWVPPWLVPDAPAGVYPPDSPVPPWQGEGVPTPVLWFDGGDPSTVIGRVVNGTFRVASWTNKGSLGGSAVGTKATMRPKYPGTGGFPYGAVDFYLNPTTAECVDTEDPGGGGGTEDPGLALQFEITAGNNTGQPEPDIQTGYSDGETYPLYPAYGTAVATVGAGTLGNHTVQRHYESETVSFSALVFITLHGTGTEGYTRAVVTYSGGTREYPLSWYSGLNIWYATESEGDSPPPAIGEVYTLQVRTD